jgi:hypothetical protein
MAFYLFPARDWQWLLSECDRVSAVCRFVERDDAARPFGADLRPDEEKRWWICNVNMAVV